MTDHSLFDPASEAPESWTSIQNRLVAEAVRHAGVHAEEVRTRLEHAGVSAADVARVEDLAAVPVLAKDDVPDLQAADPPFGGMLAVSVSELERVFVSPGPILDPKGSGIDFWRMAPAVWAAGFRSGDMVLNITEMPIKCPVAPLEFVFLADWYFTERGIRDKVNIHFVTPLPGAFTKPRASSILGDFLNKKNIHLTTDFSIGRVDTEDKKIVSWDETEVPFDVLVTIPTNMGDEWVERSGMGDELNFIPTDKHTLKALNHENIFVIGDATDLPSSKAGSVAHFQADILAENFMSAIEGRELHGKFDGHANCFIESGFGKGILIDFNYGTEPLPGKFPLPGVGPFSLLEETEMNHYGKIMFRWMYWNFLLRGKELPIESHMSMAGKRM